MRSPTTRGRMVPIRPPSMVQESLPAAVVGVLEISRLKQTLMSLEQQLRDRLQEAEDTLVIVQEMQKGERGEIGPKGDSVRGPQGPQGPKGDTGVGEPGKPGKNGKDGKTPILGIDYFVKDGKDGKDGTNGVSAEEVIAALRALPDGNKLKTQDIDGLETWLRSLGSKMALEQTSREKPYLHGGGVPSLIAGSGITLTQTPDGGFVISSSASAAPQIYDLSSLCDGNTKTFTIPANSSILGVWSTEFPHNYRPLVDWTGSGTTTLTLTSEVAAPATGQTLYIIYVA